MATNKLQILVGLKIDATEALKDLQKELVKVQALARQVTQVNGDNAVGLENLSKANRKLKNSFKETNKEMQKSESLVQKIGNTFKDAFKKFLLWTAIAAVIGTIKRTLTEAFTVVKDIDSAFVQLAITTGATAEQIKQIDAEVEGLTASVGRLKKEIIDAITEFARAGFTLEESITLAENAIIGANVGLTDLSKTSSVLIAALKSFNLEAEDSARVIDVLFNVSRNAAINFEGIGEAFLRSANSLKVAGATLEESAALIASANESIQDPAKVGTALKTISARLRGLDAENNVPKLQKALRAVGIEIQDQEGNFRDIFEIFRELSVVFGDLDDLTKQNIIEQLAGKRQANILIGLIDNFAEAENALRDGLDSAGTAAQENEKFLESIEGRVIQLQEAVNELLETIVTSDAIKVLVDGLTSLVKLLDQIISAEPAIKIIVGVTTALFGLAGAIELVQAVAVFGFGALTAGFFAPAIPAIIGITVALAGLASALNLSAKATDAKTTATKEYTEAQKELNRVIEEGTRLEQKQVKEQIKNLIDRRNEILKTLENLTEDEVDLYLGLSGDPIESAQLEAEIRQIDEALASLGVTSETAESTINSLDESIGALTEGMNQYNVAVQDLKDDIAGYYLVSDALEEMAETGYLAEETLVALQALFPDLSKTTKLEASAVLEFLEAQRDGYKQIFDEDRELTEKRIELAKLRIKSLINERRLASMDTSISQKERDDIQAQIDEATATLLKEEILLNKIDGAWQAISKSTDKSNDALSEQERLYESIKFQIATLEEQLNRVEGKDRIDIINQIIDLYGDLDLSIDEVIDSLSDQELTQDELTEAIRKYRLEQEKGLTTIFNFRKEIEKLTKEDLEDLIKLYDEDLSDSLEKSIELLKKQREELEESFNDRIKDIENEIDKLERQNELIEERIRLEELLANLQNLQAERENILQERNVRLIKNADVGFEFVADPAEVKRINEEIAQAEKDLSDFERETEFNAQMRALEDEKTFLEEQKELELEAFDDRIDSLEEYQKTVENIVDEGGQIQASLIESIQDILLNSELDSYKTRIDEFKSFVDEYNAIASRLNNSTSLSVPDVGFGSSDIATNSNQTLSTDVANLAKEAAFIGYNPADFGYKVEINGDITVTNPADFDAFVEELSGINRTQ